MPKSVRVTGRFDLRIVHLPVSYAAQAANGEEVPSWTDPPAVLREYFACRESLTGGETIVQGMHQAEGGMKLRIKGRSIPMNTADRVKVKATGELFHVVGVMRESADTVLNVTRVVQQTTGQ